jgi:phenylacetate-CoA ligase
MQSSQIRDRERDGQRHALRLFHRAARRVPAYRDFLCRHGVRPEQVQSYEAFQELPTTDKGNYISAYPLEELTWDGQLARAELLHTSSGTTGQSHFWPVCARDLARMASVYEQIFRECFKVGDRSTLLVVCFGMGMWVAGTTTLAAAQLVSRRGYDLTAVTPGYDREAALKALTALAPRYRQTVLAGIPSLVKDLADTWAARGLSGRHALKFLLAGEGFTESWRDHVLARAGSDNALHDAVSILGSADAGVLAFETPATTRLRRWCSNDREVRVALFGADRLPMLFHYLPTLRFFEEQGGELLVTADRALPLVRYNTRDQGGALTPAEVRERSGEELDRLPSVYVFGRGKFTAKLYGANVYAENVQEVLIDPAVAPHLTGRFMLDTRHDERQDPYLYIDVELAEHDSPDEGLVRRLAKLFVEKVRRVNSEYDCIVREYGSRGVPVFVLHPFGDPGLFSRGVQRKSC